MLDAKPQPDCRFAIRLPRAGRLRSALRDRPRGLLAGPSHDGSTMTGAHAQWHALMREATPSSASGGPAGGAHAVAIAVEPHGAALMAKPDLRSGPGTSCGLGTAGPTDEPDSTRRSATSEDEIDRELLRRVADADRDAFRQLYLRYHLRLCRFLARFADLAGDAEDVVNEALLIVWLRARDFRGASKVSTWIFGISYRCALTAVRRGATRSKFDALEVPGDATLAQDSAEELEDRQALEQGLAQLPTEQRLVLVLAYYLDLSCEEIAAIADCPVNTVKSRMYYARHKLRAFMSTEGVR